MADWLYELDIKSLWAGDPPDGDHNARAKEIAPEVSRRIRSLMERINKATAKRVLDRAGDLYIELDEVADMLDDIQSFEDGASAEFNDCLAMLYDIGDSDHRIWVK